MVNILKTIDMKKLLYLTMIILFVSCGSKQETLTVEASCGICQFEMEGETCDLAVRIDGKTYYVEGSGIDDHGDAHADDGFCEAIRMAKITGHIEGDKFIASSFELIEEDETGSY